MHKSLAMFALMTGLAGLFVAPSTAFAQVCNPAVAAGFLYQCPPVNDGGYFHHRGFAHFGGTNGFHDNHGFHGNFEGGGFGHGFGHGVGHGGGEGHGGGGGHGR
jgi:hypothetical protein